MYRLSYLNKDGERVREGHLCACFTREEAEERLKRATAPENEKWLAKVKGLQAVGSVRIERDY